MAIVRWSPFRDMMRLRTDMDHFFDEMVPRREGETEGGVWLPALDVSETEDEIRVKVEIPGVEKDDINLSINDNVLIIKGEKNMKKEVEGEDFHRIERVYGNFYRAIELPVLVDADKISAAFKNGILNIVLPKADEVKPKEIAIEI
ncbi:MAG: Hsp20/alpha crystallin family protein, partial [bacterium]|nr:Hsp20/alpha crystallin family protein [bacterium]